MLATYWMAATVDERIKQRITTAFHPTCQVASKYQVSFRIAAYMAAWQRIDRAVTALGTQEAFRKKSS